MLKLNNVDTFYGQIQALHDVSVSVGENEIIAIIGANGAGKSTIMKTIMGICKPQSGSVVFMDINVDRLQTHRIVQNGIIYVPEGRKILGKMTVLENLEMGAFSRKLNKAQLDAALEEVFAIFPRLKERMKQDGGTLSGGEQQMLAIARGLMAAPRLLMLDEPSMGLAPVIVDEVFEIIANINEKKGLPLLLVEQNAYIALNISQRCYVLENGRVALSGTSHELRQSDEIRKSYLGGSE